MEKMQKAVHTFHQTYGVETPTSPRPIPEHLKQLRIKLIEEELEEFRVAIANDDMVEQYDALIDILYVTHGAIDLMALDAEPGFDEVQLSNMSKLGLDGLPIISRGEELDGFPVGKVLKGPNYFKPDLKRVIAEQVNDANRRAYFDSIRNGVAQVMNQHKYPHELQQVPFDYIMNNWRPGSHDWDWEDERLDLLTRDWVRTGKLRDTIRERGFGFADATSPIKLGNDGRIWNGHHRLILGLEFRPDTLWVDVVGPDETEHDNNDSGE